MCVGTQATKRVWKGLFGKAYSSANLWFFFSYSPSLFFYPNVDTSAKLLNLAISPLSLNFIFPFIPNMHSSCTLPGSDTIRACNFSTVVFRYRKQLKHVNTSHMLCVHLFDSYAY